jgi:hypothetical protein
MDQFAVPREVPGQHRQPEEAVGFVEDAGAEQGLRLGAAAERRWLPMVVPEQSIERVVHSLSSVFVLSLLTASCSMPPSQTRC